MNGMTRKRQRREHARKYTEDGVPRDALEWQPEDWASLHRAMEAARREIAERHRHDGTNDSRDV